MPFKIFSYVIFSIFTLAVCSCGIDRPGDIAAESEYPPIYPDYIDVTIPAEIAPMNFNISDATEEPDYVYVLVTGSKGGSIESGGKWANFDLKKWHALTEQNRGGDLTFDVSVRDDKGAWRRYQPFVMHVSDYPLSDYGITYRRIAPGFETFSKIGIYQRCLANFDESPILEETAVNGQCLNCHYANRGNPQQFTLHVRGANGGTLIRTADGLQYLNTKTDKTAGSCTYGYWHPDGRYCAFSLNRIYQNFYVGPDKFTEPWDAVSDLAVLDTQTGSLIIKPELMTENFETTPAFSADGKYIYYCYAPAVNMPAQYQDVKYSLCRVPFDATVGRFGERIDTIIDADSIGRSVSLPRPSYDGRYLMYCLTEYGTTPVVRQESDLYLMDMNTGESRALDEVNSTESDAYHNWSSDSHWFLFGSRRGDHLYSYVYLSCIDDEGHATKPFLLPQLNPLKYYRESLQSMNVPDFTTDRVELDAVAARQLVMEGAESVKSEE